MSPSKLLVIGTFVVFYVVVAPLHYYIEAGRGYAFGGLEMWAAIARPLSTGLLNLFALSLAVEAGMRLYCFEQPSKITPIAKEMFLFIIVLFVLIFVCFTFTLVEHYVNSGNSPSDMSVYVQFALFTLALGIAFYVHQSIVRSENA